MLWLQPGWQWLSCLFLLFTTILFSRVLPASLSLLCSPCLCSSSLSPLLSPTINTCTSSAASSLHLCQYINPGSPHNRRLIVVAPDLFLLLNSSSWESYKIYPVSPVINPVSLSAFPRFTHLRPPSCQLGSPTCPLASASSTASSRLHEAPRNPPLPQPLFS